ncbi:hypothetical protein GOP47_0008150 [Adiantum capillus-veneris]|uniref:Uncharacterized protein n=1 Tax=Adiantum capillus-veneris TaxID=13818 RepID=A0A9D4UYE0_ADICA|nr:hypothetical protein GOP47_0008150 [Adiantum capillus-veneris]
MGTYNAVVHARWASTRVCVVFPKAKVFMRGYVMGVSSSTRVTSIEIKICVVVVVVVEAAMEAWAQYLAIRRRGRAKVLGTLPGAHCVGAKDDLLQHKGSLNDSRYVWWVENGKLQVRLITQSASGRWIPRSAGR